MPEAATLPDYFRRDRDAGITPPDLSKDCSVAEHIVRARGKRTRYTSVSLDPAKIRDFGEAMYRLKRCELTEAGHELIEHDPLLAALREIVRSEVRAERLRAIQAIRYATRRREGLVAWRFDIAAVERKDLVNWAFSHVGQYFVKV